jgi:hypothetical protein
VAIIAHVDQLHVHHHPVAFPADAAFQYVCDSKCLRYVAQMRAPTSRNCITEERPILMLFRLESNYKPRGDQGQAIATLLKSVEAGNRHQTLLGFTTKSLSFVKTGAKEKSSRCY